MRGCSAATMCHNVQDIVQLLAADHSKVLEKAQRHERVRSHDAHVIRHDLDHAQVLLKLTRHVTCKSKQSGTLIKGRRWSRLLFSSETIRRYTLHTHRIFFYRIIIVDVQNQQFGASTTSIFPYKQCKVLFGFSHLSQHWIFSMHAMGRINSF